MSECQMANDTKRKSSTTPREARSCCQVAGLLPSRRLRCPAFFGSMSPSDSLPADNSLRHSAYRASRYEAKRSVQGRVSPVHCIFFHTMPIPLRRRILRCRSKFQTASMAFAHMRRASTSSFPSREAFLTTRAGFTLCYGLVCRSPCLRRDFCRYAFTHRFRHTQVSKLHGGLAPPATGLSPARRCVPLGTPHTKNATLGSRVTFSEYLHTVIRGLNGTESGNLFEVNSI